MITERTDYSLGAWLVDTMHVISKREFIENREALLMITEDIIEFLEMYDEGLSPQAAFAEYVR